MPRYLKQNPIADSERSELGDRLAIGVGYDDVVSVLIVGGCRRCSRNGIGCGCGACDQGSGRVSRGNSVPLIGECGRTGGHNAEGGRAASSDRLARGLSDDGRWNVPRRDSECSVGTGEWAAGVCDGRVILRAIIGSVHGRSEVTAGRRAGHRNSRRAARRDLIPLIGKLAYTLGQD